MRPGEPRRRQDRFGVKGGEGQAADLPVPLAGAAEEMGIPAVMSGPMVRSSYRSGMLWGRAMRAKGRPIPAAMAELAVPGTARQEASALLAGPLGAAC